MEQPQRQTNGTPSPAHTDRSGFVGRQREMTQLRAALDEALYGRGRLVMLAGEPGIGKTRTAQELASHAETLGGQVLWGWCYEQEGAPPYWPWVQPLRSYIQDTGADQLRYEMGPGAADIGEMLPDLRDKLPGLGPPPSLEPEQARFRLFDSIARFLVNAAQAQPLMLVLDDLHWSDKPSLLLLQFLARQLSGCPMLVVGTYRDVEVSRQHPLFETLAQLARLPVFMRLELKGLDREDTADFIQSASGIRPRPQVAEAVYSHTEGNPFFLGEVVRLLSERVELASSEVSSPEDIGLPAGVREAIGQRLNRLSARCNETLSMASAIGRGFDFRLLRALSPQVTEDQLLGVIDEALGAHLIEGLPGGVERYQFSHALVQQTLSEALSDSRRVRQHARIAESLEELYGADVEAHAAELAYHFTQAKPVLGPQKLVHYSLLAGGQALAAYGWEAAMAQYQTALEELEANSRQQAEVLEKLAEVTNLGRGTGALGCLEKALAIYEMLRDNKKAGGVHLRLGSRRGAGVLDARTRHSHGVKAVQLLEPEGESPQLSQAYVRLGLSAVHGFGGLSTGLPLMEKGLALAERLGETAEVIEGARVLGHALVFHTGEIDRGLGLFRRGFEEAKKSGDLVALSETAGELSWQYAYLRDVQEALPWAEKAVDASKQAGTVGHQVESALELAWACILQGDASRARLSLETAEQVARKAGVETRSLLVQRSALVVVPGLVNIFLGDWDKAETELLRLAEFSDQTHLAPLKQFWTNPDLGWLCLERGDLEGAKAYLGESAAYCKTGGDNPPELLCRALLVQVCSKGGELEEATAHMQRARGIFSLSPDWLGLAAEVHLAEGVLATAEKRWEEAEAAFQQAVAVNRQYHLPYYEARTLLEWGQMYFARNGRGDGEKGIEFLDQALAIFQRIQAKKMVEKVSTLRERVAAGPEAAPAYPDGLTQREVEVLRLIAAGKTDREIAEALIISIRTVGNHVSNILNKCNTANRTEAAIYAARRGLV